AVAKRKITELIAEWMESFGRENGYELSRCEFVKEADSWYLRVFVDKRTADTYESMSTDDCEVVSRYLSQKLDEADPVKQNYYLEVSSPGLDRLLVSEKDFLRFKGQVVDVGLYHPLDGEKSLQGILKEKHDGILTVVNDKGAETAIPVEQISTVRLAIIF
ncbi:MAG: ribosome maturation factor RimP, partial [Anaerovoracaceae bacterium]